METKTIDIIKFLDELENYLIKNSKHLFTEFPIVRIHLGYFLSVLKHNKIEKEKLTKDLSYKKPVFKTLFLFRLINLKCKLMVLKTHNKNLLKNKVLIFGFLEHYYKQTDNIKSNLYLSPIKQSLTDIHTMYEELLVSNTNSFKSDESRLGNYYDVLFEYNSLWFAFKNKRTNETEQYIYNCEMVRSFMNEKQMSETNHFVNFYYNIQIEHNIKFNTFSELLKTISPKLIWSYCYYDNNMMALNRAANKLNIKTIEYQHSQQSDEHFAYAKWQRIDDYREFFPKSFWLWSQSDGDRLKKNFSGKKYIPQVIVGGNLAIIQKKEQFKNKSAKAHKGILVSLQGAWIPDFVESAIAQDTEHVWYFRLHPRYSEDKTKLMGFKNKFPDKVELDEANSLSLYEVFSKVKINITDFSGTALEAAEFGIKNIIIGEKGAKIYSEKITIDDYTYADSATKLMDTINNFVNSDADFSNTALKDRENLNHILSNTFF